MVFMAFATDRALGGTARRDGVPRSGDVVRPYMTHSNVESQCDVLYLDSMFSASSVVQSATGSVGVFAGDELQPDARHFVDAQLSEGFAGRMLERVGADRDGHAGQCALDEQPVAPDVLPGAQRHLRLLHVVLKGTGAATNP